MSTAAAGSWRMPDLDTVYRIEDGPDMTLGQMLDGIDPDLVPKDITDYENLLWAFGAWESLEDMQSALSDREHGNDLRVRTGFVLVK